VKRASSFIGLVQAHRRQSTSLYSYRWNVSRTVARCVWRACTHTVVGTNTRTSLVASSTNDVTCLSSDTSLLNCHRHDWPATVKLVQIKSSTNLRTRDRSVGVKIRTRARLPGYSSSIPDRRNRYLSFPQFPEGHWRPTSVRPSENRWLLRRVAPIGARGSHFPAEMQRVLEYDLHRRLFTLLIQPGDKFEVGRPVHHHTIQIN